MFSLVGLKFESFVFISQKEEEVLTCLIFNPPQVPETEAYQTVASDLCTKIEQNSKAVLVHKQVSDDFLVKTIATNQTEIFINEIRDFVFCR